MLSADLNDVINYRNDKFALHLNAMTLDVSLNQSLAVDLYVRLRDINATLCESA